MKSNTIKIKNSPRRTEAESKDNIMDILKDAGANLLNSIADDAEIVKDVYNDGLKPAVIETGKALTEPIKGATRVGKLVNALFSSIDCWILKREYAIKETQKLLEKKLKNISDDNIESPKNYIAIPALQALSYSIDSKELRNMYANLLAKSMYIKTANDVLPAYVEIIKQLSPIDVKCFEEIFNAKRRVSYKNLFVINNITRAGYPVSPYISELSFSDLATVNQSIDNLLRLGLLNYNDSLDVDDSIKKHINENQYGVEQIERLHKNVLKENEVIQFEYRTLFYTALGTLFHKICCEEIN